MPWVESASPSFRARYDSAHTREAERVLRVLERERERLAHWFPRTVENLAVVLHRSTSSLWMARPVLALAWLSAAPSARRYIVGWAGTGELHLLAPSALESRASGVPGSRQMMALTPVALLARRVIVENNHELLRRRPSARLAVEFRWAWLLEGAASWFSGQLEYAGAAIARRLRAGPRPSFPPSVRDATLLGSTVIDMLVTERDELAAVELACRLHSESQRAVLAKAFGRRPLSELEADWRAHLRRLMG